MITLNKQLADSRLHDGWRRDKLWIGPLTNVLKQGSKAIHNVTKMPMLHTLAPQNDYIGFNLMDYCINVKLNPSVKFPPVQIMYFTEIQMLISIMNLHT